MDKLFRLSLGMRRDPTVEAWLAKQPGALGDIARTWFSRIRASGLDVLEMMHDGCPVAKAHANVGFFLGADLQDPAHLLAGTGKRMRHVKVTPGEPLDTKALSALVQNAYDDVKARLRA